MNPSPSEFSDCLLDGNCINASNESCPTKTNINRKMGQLFYGVHIPPENSNNKREFHVYTDRIEALRFFKLHKRARFKPFTKETDALYFSQYGSLPSHSNIIKSSNTHLNQQNQDKSLFKTPKIQEMVKFRKVIEVNNFELFKSCVQENPRYLISSGDTPSILQEGPRYNALHIAAKFNAPNVASYILNMISTSELTNRIFGTNETGLETDERAKVLLDLYLNTPDRSLNETPLHFASKIGAITVVEVLIMYSQCLSNATNKYGQTALDVVCSRAIGEALTNKEGIEFLLKKDNFYVPVLRTNDNSVQPKVGNPITRTGVLDSLPVSTEELHPSSKVHALAGPMSSEEAIFFQKQWKKTPHSFEGALKPSLLDVEKGLERIGRHLAVKFQVQWTEYWAFLDAFVDLSSVEGLDLLEAYLKDKFCDTVAAWHKPRRVSDIYAHGGAEDVSPISELCDNFRSMSISGGNSPETVDMPVMCFEKFLEVFAKRISISLLRYNQIFLEISQLETFLTNCSRDRRFNSIDLTKAHYRLSQFVESNLGNTSNSEQLTSILTSLIEGNISDESDEDSGIVKKALVCIASFLLDNLTSSPTNLSYNNMLQNSWLRSKSCSCKLLRGPRTIRTARTSLQFGGVDHLNSSDTPSCSHWNISKHHESSQVGELESRLPNASLADQENENDESYYTAPASPFSEDSVYYDCCDVGPDTFLYGNLPTKLDASVLNAIKDVTIITSNTYPFIYYWKKICENRAVAEHSTKWPSASLKLNSSRNKMTKDIFSSTWRR